VVTLLTLLLSSWQSATKRSPLTISNLLSYSTSRCATTVSSKQQPTNSRRPFWVSTYFSTCGRKWTWPGLRYHPNTCWREWRQDLRRTDNVTLGRVRASVVAVEKQNVLHILCVCVCVCVRVYNLTYPACNAHAPYYIAICVLSDCAAVFHIISQTAQLSRKKLLKINCVFWFSAQICLQHFSP
jgi:hypothetical protein